MMNEVYQEAIGTFEGLRRLGFSADDIYLTTNGPLTENAPECVIGKIQVLVTLRTQGIDFHVSCGFLPGTVEEIEKTWRDIADNKLPEPMSEGEWEKAWKSCQIYKKSFDFLLALRGKGIVLPNKDAN